MSDDDIELAYMGFNKLKGALAKKGARNPGALAAYIGRKKYGKRFVKAIAAGRKGNKKLLKPKGK